VSNLSLIKILWDKITNKRKFYLFGILSLVNALSDAINIGLLIPFINVMSKPELLFQYPYFKYLINLFEFNLNPRIFILILFIGILLISSSFRIYINWFSLKFSYSISENFAQKIYSNVLYKDYLEIIKESSSKTIGDITYRVNATSNVILSIVLIFNNVILSLLILISLLLVNFSSIGMVLLGIGIIYLVITFAFKSEISKKSKLISKTQTELIKIVQEGIGGIKEVILTSSQSFFINEFKNRYNDLTKSLVYNSFISSSPKILIEVISIALLLMFYFFSVAKDGDITKIIGLISVIAFGAQKLLPSLQTIYQNWTNITSNKFLVLDVLENLKFKITNPSKIKKLNFEEKFELNLSKFSYEGQKSSTLEGLNLNFNKGDKIGIIGPSGTGKSTLINIISGLILDFKGEIKIDNIKLDKKNIRLWQDQIAFVPQNVFIFDSSLEENITFGIEKRKDININSLLKQVKLDKFIKGRNLKKIPLGEKANMISGGEKQRIALARALYRNTSLIIFDEATNALDKKVEDEIFKMIYSLQKTIIIITHNTKNLQGCDKIFELKNKKLEKVYVH
tara:strand:+ start:13919 stop:15622 length:1704 start_codon:yes stop_codon:yes gene_type:complete